MCCSSCFFSLRDGVPFSPSCQRRSLEKKARTVCHASVKRASFAFSCFKIASKKVVAKLVYDRTQTGEWSRKICILWLYYTCVICAVEGEETTNMVCTSLCEVSTSSCMIVFLLLKLEFSPIVYLFLIVSPLLYLSFSLDEVTFSTQREEKKQNRREEKGRERKKTEGII
eukprot:TRINITY_DN249_c0_g1_i1.p2 TRINITY_DN249_c0_g1~~TRINITY_DN249_c0_g1_i1.p2  ORF type:complete len:170 (-),score=32.69 TRINITY_DN249_c0_g1_i1:127-636(-)